MKEQRVCIVSPELIGPHRNGGIGTHCYFLAAFLSQRLHQKVTFLYTGPIEKENEAYWKKWFRREMDIEFVWQDPPRHNPALPPGFWCYFSQVADKTFEWLRQQNFDVCHFQEMLGNGFRCFQAKRMGLAFANTVLTCTVHSPWEWICEAMQSYPEPKAEEVQTKFMERYCIENCDALISLNRYMLSWLEDRKIKVPPRAVVLPNLFDLDLRAVGCRPFGNHIIFFGRLEVRKGLLLFLETLLQMDQAQVFAGRPVKVTFLGRSGYTPEGGGSRTIARFQALYSADVQLEQLNDLGQPEALKFLAEHNDALVVCPSLIDNSPYAVIESLQLGINIIAANCGGIPELFANAERLFEPEHNSLAAKLRAGLSNELSPPMKRHELRDILRLWEEFCQESLLRPQPDPAVTTSSTARKVRVVVGIDSEGPVARAMEALKSLDGQSFRNFELTVLAENNNGSHWPLEPVREYCRERGWSVEVPEGVGNRGQGGGRSDEAIVFLAPGCVAKPGLLETVRHSLQRSRAEILAPWMEFKSNGHEPFIYQPLGPCLEAGIYRNYFGAGCVVLKRTAGPGSQDWRALTNPVGQWLYLAKAALAGKHCDVIPESLLCYEGGSATLSCATLDYSSQMNLIEAFAASGERWVRQVLLNSLVADQKLTGQTAKPAIQSQPASADNSPAQVHGLSKLKREIRRIFKQCRSLPKFFAKRFEQNATPPTVNTNPHQGRRFWNRLAPRFSNADMFPSLEDEVGKYREYFRGNVLNAGAGNRDIRHLVQGKLYNQDIPGGLHNANIDILSPLHCIPVEADFFDVIICNAVLEHVENPEAVLKEFNRVCKPGGLLYLVVPFMQPEHLDPTDFQRYTIDGLRRLVTIHGFEVVQSEGVHSVYTTLGWIVSEWLNSANTFEHFLLKWLLFPYLKRKYRTSKLHVHSLASGYRVLGRKTGSAV